MSEIIKSAADPEQILRNYGEAVYDTYKEMPAEQIEKAWRHTAALAKIIAGLVILLREERAKNAKMGSVG